MDSSQQELHRLLLWAKDNEADWYRICNPACYDPSMAYLTDLVERLYQAKLYTVLFFCDLRKPHSGRGRLGDHQNGKRVFSGYADGRLAGALPEQSEDPGCGRFVKQGRHCEKYSNFSKKLLQFPKGLDILLCGYVRDNCAFLRETGLCYRLPPLIRPLERVVMRAKKTADLPL